MKQGVSRLRNRVIARVFRELNLIEQWGSAVRRIFSDAQALGLPEPVIIEMGMRVRLTIYLAEPMVLEPAIPQVTPQVTPQVERLLTVLEGEMSRAALQGALQLQDRKSFRELYLNPALADALIEMTLPDKRNSRLQKYRMTAEGRAYCAAIKQ
ncbi:Fic family protein [Janthinobacterium sp.]|uniref:Fic family protein n=1 Tax=Janthinobacterium sp. TaxID=1871054 RepID=UPI00293D96B3|nr:ATP-binding protein [Janthinobacterium sp.]